MTYSQGSLLAKDGKCKPFDSKADGSVALCDFVSYVLLTALNFASTGFLELKVVLSLSLSASRTQSEITTTFTQLYVPLVLFWSLDGGKLIHLTDSGNSNQLYWWCCTPRCTRWRISA